MPSPKILFNKSTKISLRKSEQKKKGTLSLIAPVRAVAVGEEEEMRREKRKKWRYLCNFDKLLLRNIDHRW